MFVLIELIQDPSMIQKSPIKSTLSVFLGFCLIHNVNCSNFVEEFLFQPKKEKENLQVLTHVILHWLRPP
jgi:hypothetical protein